MIEASNMKVPIISTDVGGLSFLIHHQKDGLLVKSRQVEGFVSAIQQFKDDSLLLSSITKQARVKAESYDWSTIQQLWLSVLK